MYMYSLSIVVWCTAIEIIKTINSDGAFIHLQKLKNIKKRGDTMTDSSLYGKARSKNGFSSLPVKEDIAQKIGLITAAKRLKIYEVVEIGTRTKFPEYFVNE